MHYMRRPWCSYRTLLGCGERKAAPHKKISPSHNVRYVPPASPRPAFAFSLDFRHTHCPPLPLTAGPFRNAVTPDIHTRAGAGSFTMARSIPWRYPSPSTFGAFRHAKLKVRSVFVSNGDTDLAGMTAISPESLAVMMALPLKLLTWR
jgi:hypothetical protein